MPQSMLNLTTDQQAFAEKLFELYPEFLPTRSLYLDLEGSGSGNERRPTVCDIFVEKSERLQ